MGVKRNRNMTQVVQKKDVSNVKVDGLFHFYPEEIPASADMGLAAGMNTYNHLWWRRFG